MKRAEWQSASRYGACSSQAAAVDARQGGRREAGRHALKHGIQQPHARARPATLPCPRAHHHAADEALRLAVVAAEGAAAAVQRQAAVPRLAHAHRVVPAEHVHHVRHAGAADAAHHLHHCVRAQGAGSGASTLLSRAAAAPIFSPPGFFQRCACPSSLPCRCQQSPASQHRQPPHSCALPFLTASDRSSSTAKAAATRTSLDPHCPTSQPPSHAPHPSWRPPTGPPPPAWRPCCWRSCRRCRRSARA